MDGPDTAFMLYSPTHGWRFPLFMSAVGARHVYAQYGPISHNFTEYRLERVPVNVRLVAATWHHGQEGRVV